MFCGTTFFSNMTEILEVMCPYKRVGLRDPKTPWINAEVIKAINERKKYMRLYWKTKKQFIWEICKYMHNRCNSLQNDNAMTTTPLNLHLLSLSEMWAFH